MVNPINGVDVDDSLFFYGRREKEGRTEMKQRGGTGEKRDRGEKVRVGERESVCKSM